MVSISSFAIAASTVASIATAASVNCLVNGVSVATVDSNGVCPFTIPDSLPVTFDYTNANKYDVTFYYATGDSRRFFNDIRNAGRIIDVPVSIVRDAIELPIFSVHAEQSSPSNSTFAAKRFAAGSPLYKRDAVDDFVTKLKSLDGTPTNVKLSIADVNDTSSSAGLTSTQTDVSTKIITITSCSDNKCQETTTPATLGPVTTTVNEETTVYTTWCPVSNEPTSTETDVSTKIITITSCSDNKCQETTAPATLGPVTTTVNEETTVYTTWCPVSDEPASTVKPTSEQPAATTEAPSTEEPASTNESTSTETDVSTKVITITSCSDNKCQETTAPATLGEVTTTVGEETTIYTTWCPVSESATPSETATPGTAAPGTAAPGTAAPGSAASGTAAPGTAAPGTAAPGTAAPSTIATSSSVPGTVAPVSTKPAVSTYDNAAGQNKATFLALAALPLAYFI